MKVSLESNCRGRRRRACVKSNFQPESCPAHCPEKVYTYSVYNSVCSRAIYNDVKMPRGILGIFLLVVLPLTFAHIIENQVSYIIYIRLFDFLRYRGKVYIYQFKMYNARLGKKNRSFDCQTYSESIWSADEPTTLLLRMTNSFLTGCRMYWVTSHR